LKILYKNLENKACILEMDNYNCAIHLEISMNLFSNTILNINIRPNLLAAGNEVPCAPQKLMRVIVSTKQRTSLTTNKHTTSYQDSLGMT